MGLKITFRADGVVAEFTDERQEVRFGRDPDRNDVTFDISDTRVGSEHFALRRAAGHYRLVLNRANPVWVNGEPAYDQQELDPVCVLRVGEGGPELTVERTTRSGLEATRRAARPAPGTRTLMQRLQGASGSVRRLAVAGVVVAALGILLGLTGIFRGDKALEVALEQAERVELTEQQQADLEGAIERQADALRKQEDALKRASAAGRRLHGIVARTRLSVYLVLVRFSSGRLSPVATAWVAGEGVLATNAHVARAPEQYRRELKLEQPVDLLVRSAGTDPTTLRIVSVRIHPGYDALRRLQTLVYPLDPETGAPVSTGGGYDVALLRVADEDRSKLAPPLKLASPKDLMRLGSSEDVALVGYPSENVIRQGIDPKSPEPTPHFGYITGVRNFILSPDQPRYTNLVRYSLPTLGGASGSPVLNAKGEVVALHSGGSYKYLSGERIPLTGYSFGQRANLVAELLELDDAGLARRSAEDMRYWRSRLVPMKPSAAEVESNSLAWLADWVRGRKKKFANPRVLTRITGTIAADRKFVVYRIPFDRGGAFVAAARPEGLEDLDLVRKTDEGWSGDTDGCHFAVTMWLADRAGSTELAVTIKRDEKGKPEPVRFTLYVARGDTGETRTPYGPLGDQRLPGD